MSRISIDTTYLDPFFNSEEVGNLEPLATIANDEMLVKHKGPGSDYHGWIELPNDYDKEEYARIVLSAEKLADKIDVLLVIGIGGSYLGARAALHALSDSFSDSLTREERGTPQVIFAGTQLSARYHHQLLQFLEDKRFAINIISKSGTTTEPALAFRLFRKELERRHGADGARDLIVATTDKQRGKLYELAVEKGYERFVVPDDVGGRYSVLTAVGLFPLAVAGVDTDALMEGAQEALADAAKPFAENEMLRYAAMRHALYQRGKSIELLVSYDPRFQYIAEWWKQLYGESEGKDNKALYPASAQFTADLHSLGQYIQDGRRHLFETVLLETETSYELTIEDVDGNPDGLNYLAGKDMFYVNEKAAEGTLNAHRDGGVPNVVLRMPELDARTLGYLFYFFMRSCGVSAYMLGVNPFDQPGVEAYKSNMFTLLGKPNV
ncbi:MAG: glucose-6-phosphate isomerase [Saprospiraceae bacterium]